MNLADYYQSYKNYFWIWEDDGDVLSIPGGSTIGFKAQVARLLTVIAENGLPPFGAFLMAMIATNRTMDDSVNKLETIFSGYLKSHQKKHFVQEELFTEAFEFLRMLSSIAPEFKTGRRKEILLQTIFSNSHNRHGVPTSKGIANGLMNNPKGRSRFLQPKQLIESVFFKELRVITLLHRQFPTAKSVIDAMGELPALEEDELPLLENITVTEVHYEDFVDELLHNPKTFETAALIKPIWAGFNIPIFNAHPSEQPLGGVSDLSNKGDFDKLLLAEFANDDIIFMNRVANNEALYLHREMPPVKDNLHRTILIDISLKSWGTPKILSFASYIAIARHPKALTQSIAYVTGSYYNAVSCDSPAAVIDALQQTDASLHPGRGLAAFLEDYKQDKALEIFYITTAAALKYPAVQKQLADYNSFFKYIITCEATGEINFYRNKKTALQHLQTIRLPLEKLWTPKKPIKILPPVITSTSADNIPLLLPRPLNLRKAMPLGANKTYYVAYKTLFVHTHSPNDKKVAGLELLLRNVPANSLYEVGQQKDGQVIFLSFNPQNREVIITNLESLKTAKIIFTLWNGKMFREFLFDTGMDKFIYLLQNPNAFTLIPDFEKGIITSEPVKVTSNKFGVHYPRRQEEIRQQPALYTGINILKNVSHVFINGDNYLVINDVHQLKINNGILGFASTNINELRKLTTERSGNKKIFSFKEGSKVVIDDCGYIQLISSNPSIPGIFITSTPDSIPAMATKTHFAGNELYYNDDIGKVKLHIMAVGTNPISCVKAIRDNVPLSLAEIKTAIDGAPSLLPHKIELPVAEKIVQALAAHGCTAVIEKTNQPRQTIISAEKFYLENIATFIGHIINNAAAG